MPTIQQEIAAITRTLHRYAHEMDRNLDKFLDYAAVPVVQIAQARAPVGSVVHKRYSTPKVNRALRAPKGMGQVVATYNPGNLRGAVRTLHFRRAVNAVFVGPKIAKGGGKGTFGPNRPDAYYAHMVEHGTIHTPAKPFMLPAAQEGLPIAYRRLQSACKLLTEKFNRR